MPLAECDYSYFSHHQRTPSTSPSSHVLRQDSQALKAQETLTWELKSPRPAGMPTEVSVPAVSPFLYLRFKRESI